MLVSDTMVDNFSGDMCVVVRTRKLMMTSISFCCSLETCQVRISPLWLNELWSLNSLSIRSERSLNFLLCLFLNSFCHTKPLRLNWTKKIFLSEAESPCSPLGFHVFELKCASPVQKGSNEIEVFYWNVSCTVHMTYLTEENLGNMFSKLWELEDKEVFFFHGPSFCHTRALIVIVTLP